MKRAHPRQRGVTMLVVLVLLTVMLLGGLSLARMTEIGTMAAGNSSFRDVALQTSEIGLNNAYAQVRALADPETDTGSWYFATMQPAVGGIPTIAWDSVPATTVGAYELRVAAERMCDLTAPLPYTAAASAAADPVNQCLVRQTPVVASKDASQPKIDPPNATQFRLTVRVRGPKGTEAWVQSLITRG